MEREVVVENIGKECIKKYVDKCWGECIKKEFQNYRTYVCKLRQKKDQLIAIKTKLTGLQSVKITDIPRTPNPRSDKNLYLLQEKLDIEDSLKKLTKKKEAARKKLNKILKDLESSETADLLTRKPEVLTAEASVLKLRYLCGFTWEEINKAFYEGDKGFEENVENYLRKIFRYHGQAFIDLQKMLKEK